MTFTIENRILILSISDKWEFSKLNPPIFNSIFFELLSKVGTKYGLYDNYSALNKDFEYIRKSLIEYLKEEIRSVTPIESYKELFKRISERPTTIINFNYTDTTQLAYSSHLQKSNLIHIHGELKKSNNPIVFGYAATNEQSRTLIEVGENEKMRYITWSISQRCYL